MQEFIRKEYDKAVIEWDQAVMLEPDVSTWYWKRSRACRLAGRSPQAIEDAQLAISRLTESEKPSKLPYYLQTLGEAFAAAGTFDRAMENYNKSIELLQDDLLKAPLLVERGRLFLNMGDRLSAIKDFDKAIAVLPTWGRAYFFRGQAYEGLLQPERAKQDFARASDLGYISSEDSYEPAPIY